MWRNKCRNPFNLNVHRYPPVEKSHANPRARVYPREIRRRPRNGRAKVGRGRKKETFRHRQILTRILDGRDDEAEAVRVGAPGVGDVFQRHKVGARVNRAHALLRVPAG